MKTFELDGLKITPVPVKHFGGRWLIDNLWDGEPYTGICSNTKESLYSSAEIQATMNPFLN